MPLICSNCEGRFFGRQKRLKCTNCKNSLHQKCLKGADNVCKACKTSEQETSIVEKCQCCNKILLEGKCTNCTIISLRKCFVQLKRIPQTSKNTIFDRAASDIERENISEIIHIDIESEEIDTDNNKANSSHIEECRSHANNIEEDSFEINDSIIRTESEKTFELIIGGSQKGNDILLHDGFAFNKKVNIPDDFLQRDVTVGKHIIIIFASNHQLALLGKICYMDGTFKIVKPPFIQLFSLHSFLKYEAEMKQVPLAFVLMTSKKKKAYKIVFKEIQSLMNGWTPKKFVLILKWDCGQL
ncbi:DgyrCDS14476 [Dimorphilus gyrociliatus]|uniref:DgyrCDS14476 n=1 Tax=Dimorphilus gyrociliatus TaxID=2664684 RepID=A0A7I8WDS0_9ANNE|nr:DgyrCDS14476 [Dimorphilus gyrociliatus]